MVMSDLVEVQALEALLGRECRYLGRRWRIIDLLFEEGALVLESVEGQPGIQLDQFGRASYRAPDLLQISILELGDEGLPNDLRGLVPDGAGGQHGPT